jgi:hypothetical protein
MGLHASFSRTKPARHLVNVVHDLNARAIGQLGNAAQSAANKVAAAERAEVLRAIFVETAALSTRKAAEVLNARGVANPYRQAVAAHDGGARPRATESTPERYKRGSIASVAPQERRDHP